MKVTLGYFGRFHDGTVPVYCHSLFDGMYELLTYMPSCANECNLNSPVMPNLAPRGTKTATEMVPPLLNHQR